VDPLAAFIETLAKNPANGYNAAVSAAVKAAVATKDIDAKAGRSAYVEGGRLKEKQVMDPGAWSVKVILENLSSQ
jgi:dihydroxyacetone kinase